MRASGSSQTPPSCRAAWQVWKRRRPGAVGVVEGRDSSGSAALTYPWSPRSGCPQCHGGCRPRARGMAALWARLWRVQPGDSRGADLGPRCALPAESTELLSCSSIQVKILPADTSRVCSAFRFVQENQLQQITQEAIPGSRFLQLLFIWGSQRALQI